MKTTSPFIVVITAFQADRAALRHILARLDHHVASFTAFREAAGMFGRASIVRRAGNRICPIHHPGQSLAEVPRSRRTETEIARRAVSVASGIIAGKPR